MRYEFIQEDKKAFPVTLLCRTIEVTRSGYYAWISRGESCHAEENKQMADVVKAIHAISRGSYGARRHATELTAQGLTLQRHLST